MLKGIEVNVPAITARLNGNEAFDRTGTTYSITNKGLLLRLQLSEPATSVLHQKWLGSSMLDGSKYDLPVYSFTFQSRSLHARRVGANSAENLTLLRVGEVNLDAIAAGWPAPWVQQSRMFAGDPNQSFMAVEGMVDHVEIVEKLDSLRGMIQTLPASKPSGNPVTERGSCIHPVPMVHIHVAVNDPSIRLIEEHQDRGTFFTLRSESLHLHSEAWFQDDANRKATYPDTHSPVILNLLAGLRIEPIMLHLTDAGSSSDIQYEDRTPSSPSSDFESPIQPSAFLGTTSYPLLVLGAIDINVKGNFLGYVGDQPQGGTSIDLKSGMMDIKLIVDTIVLDLTRTEWLPVLLRVVQQHIATLPKKPSKAPKPLFERLPCGYTVHAALPCIRIGVAGPGLRAMQEPSTSRGLAVRTSLSLDVSYVVAPDHTSRLRKKAKAAVRDRLGLRQEAVLAATAHAHEAKKTDGRAAYVQLAVADTTVRCIVDDNNFGWLNPNLRDPIFTAGGEEDAHILLRVPQIHSNVLLRRSRLQAPSPLPYEDSVNLEVQIPVTSARVDLHHIYCALTAMNTIQQMVGSSPSNPGISSPSSPLVVTVDVRTDIVQTIIVFPTACKTFLRFTGLSYSHTRNLHALSLINGCAWVPHQHLGASNKWDEFCRLTSWSATITSPELTVSTRGKGARFRLPYRFILNELLTDISLLVKASKHLVKMVLRGAYFPMGKPPVESAKSVPPISVLVETLMIEIGDDPFETNLNLIWQEGFREQNARLEREDAFMAKIEAIEAAAAGKGPIETMAASGRRTTINGRHTVTIDEARGRLGLYNSQAWVKRYAGSIFIRPHTDLPA